MPAENNTDTKKLYTTHEVARLLGVTPITVIRWLESGKFKCFTTVGGHRRVEHDELVRFAQAFNLPWRGEEELARRSGFVVLSVDDDEDTTVMIKDMISSMKDVQLITAANGFSAGAKLVEDRPDLVLLDFLMPELDGFEFCRFVKQDGRFKDIPVIAVTGLKTDADKAKISQAGASEILSKPFTQDQLQGVIARYVAEKKNHKPSSNGQERNGK